MIRDYIHPGWGHVRLFEYLANRRDHRVLEREFAKLDKLLGRRREAELIRSRYPAATRQLLTGTVVDKPIERPRYQVCCRRCGSTTQTSSEMSYKLRMCASCFHADRHLQALSRRQKDEILSGLAYRHEAQRRELAGELTEIGLKALQQYNRPDLRY